MDDYAKQSKGREEYLIKHAQEQRAKYDQEDEDEEERKSFTNKDEQRPRKSSDEDSDVAIPEKEELLWKDPVYAFQEYEEYILFNGEKITKPFVEKPVNAEDHEIRIYYSSLNACGSGYNVLFRKTNNFSG